MAFFSNRRSFIIGLASIGSLLSLNQFLNLDSNLISQLEWKIPDIELGPNQIFDLSSTLPSGVRKGGKFSMLATDNRYDSIIALDSNGILSTKAEINIKISDVFFDYEEPEFPIFKV